MNKRTLAAATAAIALGCALALGGAAVALGGDTNDKADFPDSAIGGAKVDNLRIGAVVQAGGTVVRSKGITGVSHPSTGLYCVDPAGAAFNVNTAVPTLSVDWSTSLGDALMAHWRSAGIGCPAGQFAILTFDGEDGSFDLSDSVSFTILVP